MKTDLATSRMIRSLRLFLGCYFAGLIAASSLNAGPASPPTDPCPLSLVGPTNAVPCFSRAEFRLAPRVAFSNPFDPSEADLWLEVRSPKGKMAAIPAFYCQEYERLRPNGRDLWRDWSYPKGQPIWKARYAPIEPGVHYARAILKRAGARITSEEVAFRAQRSKERGYVRVSTTDPRFLEHSTGEAFFAIGQNLAFVGESQYLTLSRMEQLLADAGPNGMNYARVWACAEDWGMAIEARKSAWGRSWNWNPPFSSKPMPGEDSECVRLDPQRTTIRCEPTWPAPLRPSTSYRLSLDYFVQGATNLTVEAHGRSYPLTCVTPANQWACTNLVFQSGSAERWFNGLKLSLNGPGSAFIRRVSLTEADGGPELLEETTIRKRLRGHYNLLDCHWLDEVLSAAERNGVYLQVCLLTRDLYMGALKDEKSPDYAAALQDAKNLLRYAVARWGYSPHIAAWEYFNEIDPGVPTSRFYSELATYLNEIDCRRHLRTTSTWAPSAKDCREDSLDIADVHFYLRPTDRKRLTNEVEAIRDRTAFLRQHAPRKPAHLGEFGLADDKWRVTEAMTVSRELADVHNALWASALAGGSGTALPWWWERMDEAGGRQFYRVLSRFLAKVPWTSGQLRGIQVTVRPAQVTSVALGTTSGCWLWLFDSSAHWENLVINRVSPEKLDQVEIRIPLEKSGRYRYEWWNTRSGELIATGRAKNNGGALVIKAPPFEKDIACRVWR